MSDRDVVAVLGAGGTMGMGMATNIARAGLPLVAWNRTREKAEPLSEHGARVVDTPAEAGAQAGVIVTMLTDGDAVLAAMQGGRSALAGRRGLRVGADEHDRRARHGALHRARARGGRRLRRRAGAREPSSRRRKASWS